MTKEESLDLLDDLIKKAKQGISEEDSFKFKSIYIENLKKFKNKKNNLIF